MLYYYEFKLISTFFEKYIANGYVNQRKSSYINSGSFNGERYNIHKHFFLGTCLNRFSIL